jgi:hypothetical protein
MRIGGLCFKVGRASAGRLPLFTDLGNAEVPADLAGQEVGDFGMARHSLSRAVGGIRPQRLRCAFALQNAAMFAQVL